MRIHDFLAELSSRDIRLWADGERLRCNAPAGALTPELRDRLQQCKQEVLEFLRSAEKLAQTPRAIVPLQPHGHRTPIFAVGGHNGDVFCYRTLAQRLGEDQPFYGLQPPGLDGQSAPLERIEDLAAYFAQQIQAFHSAGPNIIAGFCAGGSVAFELARQLLEQSRTISFVALFGCPFPTTYRLLPRVRQGLRAQVERVLRHGRKVLSSSLLTARAGTHEQLGDSGAQLPITRPPSDPVLLLRAKVQRATIAAARRYTPGHFAGLVTQFLPCKEWIHSGYQPLRWRSVAQGAEEYFGPLGCHSDNMLREPYAPVFAELLGQCCRHQGEHRRSTFTERGFDRTPSDLCQCRW